MNAPRFSTGAMIAIGLGVGCGSEPGILTYDEFKAKAYQEPDTGICVLNGDELIETEEAMQLATTRTSTRSAMPPTARTASRRSQQPLIVNRVGGADDKWSASAGAATSPTASASRASAAATAPSSPR